LESEKFILVTATFDSR